ncbi:hypothetical protein HBI70_011060 [Parastagonospora nodorum]|nr:hypothetical protein HBH52_089700 [Parastagonospora nodorum]KAH4180187.1 hypothetical protein HBH43_000650 [Parastagonospora nodorum]KAH4815843.1 hypothetical protein HBH61_064410 [Parastagonospora nodorum]KAH4860534.1 hypothetical protein HBH75_039320 [Parastagonospora nodorum]KAH5020837.1 hypothetical protein HBI74_147500 [Parastagonospora nodorum]
MSDFPVLLSLSWFSTKRMPTTLASPATIRPFRFHHNIKKARTQGVLDSLKGWPHSEITSGNLRRRERK